MKKTLANMNALIAEYKEYQSLAEELTAQMDELKRQAIEIMSDEGIDEFTCDDGKITYREVIGTRFASTEFKKLHLELYRAFLKQTSYKRFTCI